MVDLSLAMLNNQRVYNNGTTMAFNIMGTTMGFKEISCDNLGYNMI